jgi:hypothetical protein
MATGTIHTMALFSDTHRTLLANLMIGFLVLDIFLFVVEEVAFSRTGLENFNQAFQVYYLMMIIPVIVIVLIFCSLRKPADTGWRMLSELLAVLFILMQLEWYGQMLVVILRAGFHF